MLKTTPLHDLLLVSLGMRGGWYLPCAKNLCLQGMNTFHLPHLSGPWEFPGTFLWTLLLTWMAWRSQCERECLPANVPHPLPPPCHGWALSPGLAVLTVLCVCLAWEMVRQWSTHVVEEKRAQLKKLPFTPRL